MHNRPENQVNAGFFVRLAAYLVDCLIVWIALLVVRIPIAASSVMKSDSFLTRDLIFSYSIEDILCYLLSAAYFILLTYHTGATIGKRLLNLRVVSKEDRKLTLFEVAFRETVGRFLSELILNVGYIMVGLHKEKLGLHDMLSDTEVIYWHTKKIEVESPIEEQFVAGKTAYAPADYMPVSQPASEENFEERFEENVEENLAEIAEETREEESVVETEIIEEEQIGEQ